MSDRLAEVLGAICLVGISAYYWYQFEQMYEFETPEQEQQPNSKSVGKQIVAWAVVGGVILLLLGAGFTFMTVVLPSHLKRYQLSHV